MENDPASLYSGSRFGLSILKITLSSKKSWNWEGLKIVIWIGCIEALETLYLFEEDEKRSIKIL